MAVIASRGPYLEDYQSGEGPHFYEPAVKFTPSATAAIGSFKLWVLFNAGSTYTGGTIHWAVYGDDGGLPDSGNVIGSGSTTSYLLSSIGSILGKDGYEIDITVTGGPTVNSGTTYWLGYHFDGAPTTHGLLSEYSPMDDARRDYPGGATWTGGKYRKAFEISSAAASTTPVTKTTTLIWDLVPTTPLTKTASLVWNCVGTPLTYFYDSPAEAIADGMLHYWPMNESSGQVMEDKLKVGFDATMVASDDAADNSIVAGGYGTARQMAQGGAGGKGPQFHIQTEPPGPGTAYASWSWLFWFEPDGALDYPMVFVDWNSVSNNAAGGLKAYPQPTDAVVTAQGLATVPFSSVSVGNKYLMAIVCDAGTLSIYLNSSTPSGGGSPGFSALNMEAAAQKHLGHGWDGAAELTGVNAKMWDSGVWGRALSGVEIGNILNGGAGGTGQVMVSDLTPVSATTALLWDVLNPSQAAAIFRWNIDSDIAGALPRAIGVQYRAYITGAADGLPDYRIRPTSFSARLKSGTPSTVTLAAAWQADAATAIAARPNGDLVIQRAVVYSYGPESVYTIATVGIDELRTDQGGTSRAITITGSRQTTNGSPKTVALSGVSYRSERAGALQIRGRVDPTAKAGDTFTSGADSFVASSVIISVANGRESMEVIE